MRDWLDTTTVGDCRKLMAEMIAQGIKVNCIVTSPPYWALREYGVRGQYGQEATPKRHVARMRSVFALARELLADDGTCWLNYGDGYAGAPGGGQGKNGQRASRTFTARMERHKRGNGLKPKDLVGMPWRVALALQEDGWWLRSEIIWSKPNPMPETVSDRPTKSHEHIFLLTRSARYYYDADAIAEPTADSAHPRKRADQFGGTRHEDGVGHSPGSIYTGAKKIGINPKAYANNGVGFGHGFDDEPKPRVKPRVPSGWDTNPERDGELQGRYKQNPSFSAAVTDTVLVRNARTVWEIPTQAFAGAHFATFPEELVKRCVLAGSRPGDVVFDPFHGSGTTGAVALSLGRHFIGLELNPKYAAMAIKYRSRQLGFGI
jgi:DNA modification methylase